MARVRSLQPGKQSIRAHETEVDCFYKVLADENGETLIHLTTFGSDHRKSNPKSSQSLQLDADMARRLVAVLRDTFPDV